jgi:hypothetical protein
MPSIAPAGIAILAKRTQRECRRALEKSRARVLRADAETSPSAMPSLLANSTNPLRHMFDRVPWRKAVAML